MFPQNCSELEELVQILLQGDLSRNGGLKTDEHMATIINKLLLEEPKITEQVIELLITYNTKNEGYYLDLRSSFSIMLSYASCKLGRQQQSLNYARRAINPFFVGDVTNPWNRALAFWSLGIAEKNNRNIDEAKNAFTETKGFLEKHAKDAQRKDNIATRDLCREYIRRIEQIINNIPASSAGSGPLPEKKEPGGPIQWVKDRFRASSPLPSKGPEETILKNTLEVNIEQLSQMNRESESPTTNQRDQLSTRNLSPNVKPSVFHIVIPIDTQALFNPQWGSRVLDRNMYEQLRSYNNIQKPDRVSTDKGEQSKNPPSTKRQRVIIPAFPIYGRVTASPEGGVTFDEPEYTTNEITEDYFAEFFGTKHKAYSTKEKDSQIKIAESQTYGWFKVAGESMNLASPTRIENGDYVLFFLNNDPEACEKKIVIATQPSLDVQLPIVKRFIAIASTSRSKQSGNIQKKYYFRSESSRNKFRNDIEFTGEHRLIGEVIAVAKPVK